MSFHILMVFPKARTDQAVAIKGAIKAALKFTPLFKHKKGEVEIVKNIQAAWESLEKRRYRSDLIITHLHLPPDQDSPLDRTAQLGLKFLQDLSAKQQHLATILVAPAREDRLSQALKPLSNCELILEGEQLFEDLPTKVLTILSSVTYHEPVASPVLSLEEPQPEKIFGNVDIYLDLDSARYGGVYVTGNYEMYTYKPDSGRKNFIGPRPLHLTWRTLYDLATRSKELENLDRWPKWEKELKAVGDSLRCEICEREEDFKNDLKRILSAVQNKMANLRFRFKLSLGNKQDPDPLSFSEHLQEVVLEAMLDDQKEFLMLQAPIFRRLSIPHGICAIDGEDDLYELFSKQDRALRCLIIEAYTSGNARLNDEIITGLKPLKYLHQESQTLEKFLLQSHHEVTRLSKDHLPENLSFKDWVKQVLKEDGPWDLVHFAGHSTYATDKTGYVIFPGKNYAESMNIEDFSGLLNLARVKFVILGFRWRIDDEPAKDYAVVFYERLIKRRSLEQAFLEARTFMHNHKRYKKNRIWASPLLILQRP
ncbi:MAG: hypothetical protein P8168_15335 [Deltaproteobacteria bacterium]